MINAILRSPRARVFAVVGCLVLLGLVATVGGWGWSHAFGRAAVADAKQPANPPAGRREYRSRIVRALASVFNEMDDSQGTDDERRLIEESLDRADEELARVLEQHPREAILAANQRLCEVVILPGPAPGAGDQPPAQQAVPEEQPAASADSAPKP